LPKTLIVDVSIRAIKLFMSMILEIDSKEKILIDHIDWTLATHSDRCLDAFQALWVSKRRPFNSDLERKGN